MGEALSRGNGASVELTVSCIFISYSRRPLTLRLVNRDDFISRWNTSNWPRDEVITGNMNVK